MCPLSGRLFVVCALLVVVLAPQSALALPNPAATYCEKMGYKYAVIQRPGGARGVVVVAPGVEFDAWDFFKGKVGSAYGYGALFGYETVCERRDVGTHVEEVAVCVRRGTGAKGAMEEERISLLDLMERNGEPLFDTDALREAEASAGALAEFSEEPAPTEGEPQTFDLPSSFCWTNYNGHRYIGAIRDQGDCGSCYAFGACATAEGVYNYANGLYDGNCVDFSESFIAWCLGRLAAYNDHFFGCDGADYDYYELAALTNEGVCSEADFPYRTTDPGTCTHWSDPRTVFKSWHRVACNDIEAIKTAIMTYGVVDAALYVTTSFESYSGGIWGNTTTNCTGTPCYYASANHAIALVGWNDADGGYWILRNSWNTTWGENGYMRIRYKAAHVACAVVYVTYNPPVPTVATVPATLITNNAATLNGTVNPNAQATTYWFEYGTSTSYGATTPHTGAGSGSTAVAVSNRVTGLSDSTTYHFRLVATNAGGANQGADEAFMTIGTPSAPQTVTDPATAISATSARLHGTVNPCGAATLCWFEYGATTNYGLTTTPASAGSGWSFLAVSNTVGELNPSSTYHFRLVASNSLGKTVGADQKFDSTAVTATLLAEDFENGGSIPAGWLQQYLTNTMSWLFVNGDGAREYDKPASAHSGSYNANLYYGGYTPRTTRLITPAIDFGANTNNPTLTFWHYMEEWYGDQDELRILYRTSAGGAWTVIQAYTSSVASWTQRTIALPSPNSTYYIAFQGTAKYGYGIAVDDVLVTGEPPPPPGVTTEPASLVATNTATLNGSVNPNGLATTYWFEYGTNTNYGSATSPESAGAGSAAVAVSNGVSDLDDHTLYHFRVAASNASGVSYGSDAEFTTMYEPPPVVDCPPEGVTASSMILQWNSFTNRFYAVLYSTNLMSGFQPLATNLPGTPPVNVYTDQIEDIQGRYYRVREEE
ncbi:MAG: choice-of-anchor J domain-containing protein [Kiritimatiellae bacterium]|nr:choice-of-anchor J domain-containing protein [Kiritimatiellia bacterium]